MCTFCGERIALVSRPDEFQCILFYATPILVGTRSSRQQALANRTIVGVQNPAAGIHLIKTVYSNQVRSPQSSCFASCCRQSPNTTPMATSVSTRRLDAVSSGPWCPDMSKELLDLAGGMSRSTVQPFAQLCAIWLPVAYL